MCERISRWLPIEIKYSLKKSFVTLPLLFCCIMMIQKAYMIHAKRYSKYFGFYVVTCLLRFIFQYNIMLTYIMTLSSLLVLAPAFTLYLVGPIINHTN